MSTTALPPTVLEVGAVVFRTLKAAVRNNLKLRAKEEIGHNGWRRLGDNTYCCYFWNKKGPLNNGHLEPCWYLINDSVRIAKPEDFPPSNYRPKDSPRQSNRPRYYVTPSIPVGAWDFD